MSPRAKPNRTILDNAPYFYKRRSYAKEYRSRSPEISPSYPRPGSVSPSEKEDSHHHHQPQQRLDTNTETPREDNRSTKALFV